MQSVARPELCAWERLSFGSRSRTNCRRNMKPDSSVEMVLHVNVHPPPSTAMPRGRSRSTEKRKVDILRSFRLLYVVQVYRASGPSEGRARGPRSILSKPTTMLCSAARRADACITGRRYPSFRMQIRSASGNVRQSSQARLRSHFDAALASLTALRLELRFDATTVSILSRRTESAAVKSAL